ncbi:Pentatricopeptide repeat-containing protein [Sesamum angolense]|uniref:Pentatricopeptide repeat-containing protein n=1 Tax=Sesamum angolense TaxID=2727404 RepID=A0AAE2BXD8_9LAMI|nr:Pentatricopeptide repeat-containing protein [Sesamum angolense]
MYKRAAEQNCLALLQLCNSLFKLTQVHAKILKLESELHCYDTFLFNSVIKAYAETTHSKTTAICYYKEMLSHGVEPNNYTYPFVFKACAGIGDLNLGKMVHGSVLKLGFCGDTHVLNTMIHMYCSCENGIAFGEKLFDEMSKMNSGVR